MIATTGLIRIALVLIGILACLLLYGMVWYGERPLIVVLGGEGLY